MLGVEGSSRERGSRGCSSCESDKTRKPEWEMSFCLVGHCFYALDGDLMVIPF